MVAWHAQDLLDGQPDWRATRWLLYDNYVGTHAFGRHFSWVESTINIGATTLALLYGDGDFEQTVQIAILAGWDSDCNPATAGGLLGLISGYSGLPVELTAQCGDVYRNLTRPDLPAPGPPPQDDSILAICTRWQTLAEQVILAAGGTIGDDAGQRVYHCRTRIRSCPNPKCPIPTTRRGPRGALRAAGEVVTMSAT
jgi:hypothetical protein